MRYPSKRLMAGLVLAGLFVIGLILILHSSPKKPVNPGDTGQHLDSFSHETVSSPQGKAPEQVGTTANKPLYLGFDKLLNYGITSGQLEDVEIAFYRYSQSLPSPIKTVSVGVDHIDTNHNPSDPKSPFDILFPVQFDEKAVYEAKVEYTGLNDVRLFISNQQSGKVIFDSQTLYSGLPSD